MGIPILTISAAVQCMHAGTARPVLRNPRVKIGGENIVTVTCNYAISGCTLPAEAGGPDTVATWSGGAARVTAGGLPVVLQTSPSTCVPSGTPLVVSVVQSRVTAV